MMKTIISTNQTDEALALDYKSLAFMLGYGHAQQYDSATSLFESYDARSLSDKASIEAAKSPLYVIHNFEDLCFEYTPVYDASLTLVGFLD